MVMASAKSGATTAASKARGNLELDLWGPPPCLYPRDGLKATTAACGRLQKDRLESSQASYALLCTASGPTDEVIAIVSSGASLLSAHAPPLAWRQRHQPESGALPGGLALLEAIHPLRHARGHGCRGDGVPSGRARGAPPVSLPTSAPRSLTHARLVSLRPSLFAPCLHSCLQRAAPFWKGCEPAWSKTFLATANRPDMAATRQKQSQVRQRASPFFFRAQMAVLILKLGAAANAFTLAPAVLSAQSTFTPLWAEEVLLCCGFWMASYTLDATSTSVRMARLRRYVAAEAAVEGLLPAAQPANFGSNKMPFKGDGASTTGGRAASAPKASSAGARVPSRPPLPRLGPSAVVPKTMPPPVAPPAEHSRLAQLAERKEYLANFWYAAALSENVTADKPTLVEILDARLVLFRDERGVVQALPDACPHRGAPLSEGWVAQHGGHSCVVRERSPDRPLLLPCPASSITP